MLKQYYLSIPRVGHTNCDIVQYLVTEYHIVQLQLGVFLFALIIGRQ